MSQQREDDRLIQQLITELREDRLVWNEWRKTHDESALVFRESIDRRLKPIEGWVSNANWTWKLFFGAVAMTGAFFKCWDWIRAHFKG